MELWILELIICIQHFLFRKQLTLWSHLVLRGKHELEPAFGLLPTPFLVCIEVVGRVEFWIERAHTPRFLDCRSLRVVTRDVRSVEEEKRSREEAKGGDKEDEEYGQDVGVGGLHGIKVENGQVDQSDDAEFKEELVNETQSEVVAPLSMAFLEAWALRLA